MSNIISAILQKESIDKWEIQKRTFDEKENNRRLEIEKTNQQNQEELNILNKRISGDASYIMDTSIKMIEEITLPVDFSVDIQYDDTNKTLCIDLDLPEIENMPDKKATELASGKVKVKDKTQKELKKDYATCVTGMAFYLAGICFNISPKIRQITVSGYTQRTSKKTGNIDNDYVYSVIFYREKFSTLNVNSLDPVEAITNFEHRLNVTATFEMKTIEPILV